MMSLFLILNSNDVKIKEKIMPIPAMRRNDRQLSTAQTIAILNRGNHGVLSTIDPENQPYGVPVNYVYHQGAIYFHCAPEGYKLLNISHQPQVSFCVIEKSDLNPETFSTDYVSAIVFGKANTVDGQEKIEALQWLIKHLAGSEIEKGDAYIQVQAEFTKVIRIDVEVLTGKAKNKDGVEPGP
jgi:nitroimidazol reductase NimA-like FMN-containing flavoprotein (pyridoxamine 5'-phosphate oxidase superfamily)